MGAILLLAGMIGVIPAVIAARKGYGFFGWWLFGTALFIVALPVAILMRPSESRYRQCPDCAETVLREAKVCRYCGCKLEPIATTGEPKHLVDSGRIDLQAISRRNRHA